MSNLILTKLDLKEQNEQLVKDLRTARISVVSYKTGLESVEARLLVFKKNKSVYEEDIKLLKREIYLRDLDITELKRKLELATKEKDECKTRLGYNAVPPPYTGNFMPPKSDLVYPSLDDFVDVNESVSESVVEKPTVETNEPKTARKENGAPIIEIGIYMWAIPQQDLKDKGVIDSGFSRHMTGNRSYLADYEEIDGGFVTFGGNSKRGKITRKRKARIETVHGKDYIMLPMWPADLLFSQNSKDSPNARFKPLGEEEKIYTKDPGNESEASGKDSKVPSIVEPREDQRVNQEKDDSVNNTNTINTVIPTVNAVRIEDNVVDENIVYGCADDLNMPKLEDIVYWLK
ncbi:hypothetical protein Tco_1011257 [Tanacetum coccineum]